MTTTIVPANKICPYTNSNSRTESKDAIFYYCGDELLTPPSPNDATSASSNNSDSDKEKVAGFGVFNLGFNRGFGGGFGRFVPPGFGFGLGAGLPFATPFAAPFAAPVFTAPPVVTTFAPPVVSSFGFNPFVPRFI
jgi:hypothetical protein